MADLKADFSKYSPNSAVAVSDDGWFVADVHDSLDGKGALVATRTGAVMRRVAKLAVELANSGKSVAINHYGRKYDVGTGDTQSSLVLRISDGFPAGSYLMDIKTDDAGVSATVKRGRPNLPLYDVIVDAARVSEANGGKPVTFDFNGKPLTVNANSDFDAVEATVPKWERTTNIPSYEPPRGRSWKVGSFILNSRS